jgi:hypothetical protein
LLGIVLEAKLVEVGSEVEGVVLGLGLGGTEVEEEVEGEGDAGAVLVFAAC